MTKIIDTSKLPTHIALVGRRLNFCNPDDLAARFLETSYLAEVSLKTIASVLHGGLERPAKELAYRHAYELVRADGLGTWENSIRELATPPSSSYLPPEFFTLLAWITKKRSKPEDESFRAMFNGLRSILSLLGVDDRDGPRTVTARDLMTALVQIRNKTRAHGAVSEEFYAAANGPFLDAIQTMLESCPAFTWRWLHLSKRESGKIRAIALRGLEPQHLLQEEASTITFDHPDIYVSADQSTRLFACGPLLRCNRECTSFLLPNGGMNAAGVAEFIDYGSGITERVEMPEMTVPPVRRAPSETEGLREIDVQSNVFGNLPPAPDGYVRREKLEAELMTRLRDKNHAIITLHGGGGMGKTSLAIWAAHELAGQESPQFDHIIWFSARDVDLRPSGPSEVRQNVVDLKTVSQRFGELFSTSNVGDLSSTLAAALESAEGISEKGKGILFIFDNFETMADVRGFHKFLDEHTHLPNKVLITSRDRAFVADYPIEVRGMEFSEARQLLLGAARELLIEGLMTADVIQRIYDFTGGHAYVMRVVAGEMAKDGRYSPPAQLMGRRDDIVDAVFERSFNKLSEAGRSVFLIVANWKADVAELPLILVLGIRGIDAEAGVEECKRLSLVLSSETGELTAWYSVPQLARVFGQKKLQGDPDRLVIQEDLATIRRFTSANVSFSDPEPRGRLVKQFIQMCMAELQNGAQGVLRADGLLEGLARLWPQAWLSLADFRERSGAQAEAIDYALRRAVEEDPYSKEAWLRRAAFAARRGDEPIRIASLVSAVEASPKDLELIREVAFQLCSYINTHRAEIPTARRGIYLTSVRSHMERLVSDLDATGLSRLAWLYLLEENIEKARYFANKGCERDPTNAYCIRILERLEDQS